MWLSQSGTSIQKCNIWSLGLEGRVTHSGSSCGLWIMRVGPQGVSDCGLGFGPNLSLTSHFQFDQTLLSNAIATDDQDILSCFPLISPLIACTRVLPCTVISGAEQFSFFLYEPLKKHWNFLWQIKKLRRFDLTKKILKLRIAY